VHENGYGKSLVSFEYEHDTSGASVFLLGVLFKLANPTQNQPARFLAERPSWGLNAYMEAMALVQGLMLYNTMIPAHFACVMPVLMKSIWHACFHNIRISLFYFIWWEGRQMHHAPQRPEAPCVGSSKACRWAYLPVGQSALPTCPLKPPPCW